MNRKTVSRLLAGAAISAMFIFPGQAYAGSRDDVIKILNTYIKAAGGKEITQEEITGDDAKFTLKNVEIDTGKEEDSVTAEEITFVGAKPNAEGGFSADEIDVTSLEISDTKGGLSAATIKITGYSTPSVDKFVKPGAFRFTHFEATELEMGDEKLTVPVAKLEANASDYVDGVPHKSSFAITEAVIPVQDGNPDTKPLSELGYKELNFNAAFAVNWDDKGGHLVFDNWNISAKDAGALKIALAIGNVTPDVMKQLQALKGDSSAAMGILQGLSIESAQVRVENNSLYDRILEQEAKKQGLKKEDLAKQAATMLPLVLSSLQNPAFEKKVTDAVNAFVASPKSLTVSVAPAQPVPVAQIIGTVAAAPQTLPQVLGADINANK